MGFNSGFKGLNNYRRFEELVQEKQFFFFSYIFFGMLGLAGDSGIHQNFRDHLPSDTA